ncbi:NmrA family NAD(P)-binding protein [Chitinophaga sp. RAB17]|uniref:NmrA family NAD(P)-binding protein n=1 Tax=Chitinophaga sp. RAB17 TaxID=3233049 RepID=UPI003F8F68EB
MNQDKTIIVTGATGQVGSATVMQLLKKGFTVKALVRDAATTKAQTLAQEGAVLVTGDMNDAAALKVAFEGAYGVVSIQPQRISENVATPGAPAGFTDDDQVRYAQLVVDAAVANQVAHVIYCSVAGVDVPGLRIFDMKRRGEEYLRASGLPFTMLRPYNFMENYFGGWGDWAREGNGQLPSPIAPHVKEHLVATTDIGAFAAIAFAQPQHFIGQSIELAGDAQTVAATAACMARLSGKEINYVNIPAAALQQIDGRLAEAVEWLNSADLRVNIPALRQWHPGLLTFEAWLQQKINHAL